MKLLFFTIMLMGSFAFAASTKPLITKSSGSGFVDPNYARYETCDIYANKVVITKRLGANQSGLTLTEERKIVLAGNIDAAIKASAQSAVTETKNYLCDGPSSYIHTNLEGDAGLIFSTGGCGSPRKERVDIHSARLAEIVNQYCPHTFDFAQEDNQ